MIQQFTFRNNLIRLVLENAHIIFPGIRKAIAVYQDTDNNTLIAFERSDKSEQTYPVELDSLGFNIEEERSLNKPFGWIGNTLKPPERSVQPKQLEFNDELNYNILIIRLPAIYGTKKDLILFFLEEGMSLLQVTIGKTPLSAREKNIIGQLTYNAIFLFIYQHKQDKNLFNAFNSSFHNTIENLKSKESELKQMRQNYMQSIISFCNFHLKKISDESNYAFKLSENAIDKIGAYKDKFELLESIITNAASIALNRSYSKEGSTVVIDSSDIVLFTYEPEKIDLSFVQTDRYTKTREILDRYEYASEKVLDDRLPLTGKNVGMYCRPPISPAAITDSIYKHGLKMKTLFEKNPNKWPIIRSRFKPIINLLSDNKGGRMKIAN